MKNTFKYLCLLLITHLLACNSIVEKEDTTLQSKNFATKYEISNIPIRISLNRTTLLNYNIPEQRERFKALSPEEKADLWKNRIGEAISLKQWTSTQRELLISLYNHISPSLYKINSLTAENENKLFEQKWIEMAQLNFDRTELALIVAFLIELKYDVVNQKIVPLHQRDSIQLEDAGLYCECNRFSDWCFYGFRCKLRCAFSSPWGCGFMWQYPCDGTCGPRPIIPE